MKLALLLLIIWNPLARAGLTCIDLTGEYYLNYPIVGRVAYLNATQGDCNSATLYYKMKNGMTLNRPLVFDNTKRESARDDQAGWYTNEWIQIEKSAVKVFGEKIENKRVVETTLQTFTSDSKGNLIDQTDTFNESGKRTDTITFTYERIVH